MRTFVAFELPEAVGLEAVRRAGTVRDRLPAARWVRSEALHLTLRFLGEIEPEEVADLSAPLAAAFGASPPLTLALHGGGCYPSGRPARVAWAGVRVGEEDDPEPLVALQAAVERAVVDALGLDPQRRPFSPHVTLARCKRPWRRPDVERFTAALDGPVGEPFRAERGVLIESRLTPRGAQYRTVEELFLGAPARGGRRGDERGDR